MIATVSYLQIDIGVAMRHGHIADTPHPNTKIRSTIDIAENAQLLLGVVANRNLKRYCGIPS